LREDDTRHQPKGGHTGQKDGWSFRPAVVVGDTRKTAPGSSRFPFSGSGWAAASHPPGSTRGGLPSSAQPKVVRILYLVESRPGRSALELSQAIYGDEASELRVRQDLGRLVSSGEIECRTNGSLNHPPSYFPIPLRRQE